MRAVQALIVSLYAALALFAVSAKAAPGDYAENPAMARELVGESIQTGKQWTILQADCRTIRLGSAGAAITGDPTECLVVSRNGRGKPIFCGILHVSLSVVDPAVLVDVDYADQARCKDVKKFLKSLPRRYVATTTNAGAPIA